MDDVYYSMGADLGDNADAETATATPAQKKADAESAETKADAESAAPALPAETKLPAAKIEETEAAPAKTEELKTTVQESTSDTNPKKSITDETTLTEFLTSFPKYSSIDNTDNYEYEAEDEEGEGDGDGGTAKVDREKAKIANDKQTKSENYMKNIDELKKYLTDYTPKEKQTVVDTPSTQPGTTSRQIPIMISRSLNKLHDVCFDAFYPNSKTDKDTFKDKPIMSEITKLYTLLEQYKVVKTAEANNKEAAAQLAAAEKTDARLQSRDENSNSNLQSAKVIPSNQDSQEVLEPDNMQAQAQTDQQTEKILERYKKNPPTPLGTSYSISLVKRNGELDKQATVTEQRNETDENIPLRG